MKGNLLGLWKEVRAEKRDPCVKGGDSPLNPPHLPETSWWFLTLCDVSVAWTQDVGLLSDKAEPFTLAEIASVHEMNVITWMRS